MATTGRSKDLDVSRSPLGEAMKAHPGRFDFFQLVRLIERIHPSRVPVGGFGPPRREAMRFAVNNSLAFPPTQIHALDWPDDQRPTITVNFLGLTGAMGVLPIPYTELVRDRAREKDRAMRDFFDLFHHRILSLFYQAWKKYRFFVPYERDHEDRFSRYLGSFVGLGTEGLAKRQAIRDDSFLYYSGLLALQPRSAAALEQMLSDYFDVPVAVEQFIGAWYPVAMDDQCCLDSDREYTETLGTGALAGDEVWDHQSRARVILGPLSLERYRDFLPIGRAYEPLRTMLRFFAGNEIEFEVQLVLKSERVPACEMGVAPPGGPLLGWTTWIKSGDSFGRNAADAVLLLN